MTARAGLAAAVMALAVGHVKAGRPEKMRSRVTLERDSVFLLI